jgi:hypothetical protein
MRVALAVLTLLVLCASLAQAQGNATGPSIIGIDHMPTPVKDLDQATAYFQGLGFAIKPGRFHSNGIRTNNIKFPDGSGIELISTGGADSDSLAAHYTNFLKTADGPAYIAFHVRDPREMNRALNGIGVNIKDDGDFDDPLLDFLFLVGDNRASTDRPEHFAHANSAMAMTGVWLALDTRRRDHFRRLMASMGALETTAAMPAPIGKQASIFTIQNGRVVVLPAHGQLYSGRPIIGVEFQVREFAKTPCNNQGGTENPSTGSSTTRRCVLSPRDAHGMWVEFHQ